MEAPMKWMGALVLALAGCGSSGGGGPGRGGVVDPPAAVDMAEAPYVDVSRIWAHSGDTLYSVDPVTFDLQTVGKFGVRESMTDLAVTPNGEVYGISMTSLYRIERSAARATVVFDKISQENVALTFQTDGTLLMADKPGSVRVINPTSGAISDVGIYGGGFNTAGDLVAVADGTMYGISESGPGSSVGSNVLITVDGQGRATPVGGIGFDEVWGLAYAGGRVLAFTSRGEIISIDRATGKGTLVRSFQGVRFYGAGTSPLMPVM
jgi:hypothetical protein